MSKSHNKEDLLKAKYPKCLKEKQHSQEALNLICLNPGCKGKGLICSVCKTAQHRTHNVIPLKMLINKSDELLRTQTQIQAAKGQQSKHKGQQLKDKESEEKTLQKLQQQYLESMYMLKLCVQQITGQIMKCQEYLIKEYNKAKQTVINQHNIVSLLQTVLMECSRPPEELGELNRAVLRLMSMVKIQKNQYTLNSQLNGVLTNFKQLTTNFKKNIVSIFDEQMSFLHQIFEAKLQLRPSTTKSEKTSISKSSQKYTFSQIYKSKSITLQNQGRQAKQGDPNTGKIIFVNEKMGQKKQSIKFKIIEVGTSVCFGVGLREVIKNRKFKFTSTPLGHGTFMLGSNSDLYSHVDPKQNSTIKGFVVHVGEQVQLELDGLQLRFKKKGQTKIVTISLKDVKQNQLNQLAFCVCLNSNQDKVMII